MCEGLEKFGADWVWSLVWKFLPMWLVGVCGTGGGERQMAGYLGKGREGSLGIVSTFIQSYHGTYNISIIYIIIRLVNPH